MPVVKGGVWTNIEDEVLKAAVSKYGLNQWARVSSLLARKTPKQCKARWQEWLDPSIKKVEFTKEEDEKLLHLAKLMPTQWRTIAPIVGRTANQCIERYQKLLDEAEQREASELSMTGGDEASAPTADDVRRLRPGEVDPDPETKPARPDTIDLDEDEKEMLSEARARLANTQGKKAKRKARERQQEESRRLAALQKRRELKTAGINIKVTTRKKGQMDYNADIPFEKKAAPGFYDTTDELSLNERQRANFDPRKQQLAQAKRKQDEEEEAGRKRRKADKDAPSASYREALKAGQMQRIREAEQSSKRRALVLPAPQVGEGELEEIVKMGLIGERANLKDGDGDSTRALVNSYTTLNTGAPIRTPRAPAHEDHIANEIRNIRALTETQSSLLGGENTPLHEGAGSTGFESAAPRMQNIVTPNPMATPMRQNANGVGATPLRPGQTPLRTPRDSFALNAQGSELVVRQQLKRGLASLPKPKQQSWELELPDEQEEVTVTESGLPEDAAERDRRERELREAQELLGRKRRTQVMQRNLPRPVSVDVASLLRAAEEIEDPAERDIAREAALLMANDAARYPPAPAKPGAKPPRLDQIDDDALAEARRQILREAKDALKPEEIEAAWSKTNNNNSLLLGLGCYDDDEEEEKLNAMKAAFEEVQDGMIASAEKGAKLEKKLNLHLGGYKQRAQVLRKKIEDAAAELEKATHALNAFRILANSEQVAVRNRLAALREEVGFISKREREAQELYRQHKDELSALTTVQVTNGYH